jgi:rubredoxin
MDDNLNCPRCKAESLASFPFGFVTKPVGPMNTYICSGCKLVFATGDDFDVKAKGAHHEHARL